MWGWGISKRLEVKGGELVVWRTVGLTDGDGDGDGDPERLKGNVRRCRCSPTTDHLRSFLSSLSPFLPKEERTQLPSLPSLPPPSLPFSRLWIPLHPMGPGLWTLDSGLWPLDSGLWTLAPGSWLPSLCPLFASGDANV